MSELRTAEVEDLLSVLVGIHDADTAYALFEDLFTIREIRETSQRLAVARMLDAGNSYIAIEEATGASATTIARVSKALNYGAGGYRAALELLEEQGRPMPSMLREAGAAQAGGAAQVGVAGSGVSGSGAAGSAASTAKTKISGELDSPIEQHTPKRV